MSQLALNPIVSEKAFASTEQGTYVFMVPRGASKVMIAKQVAQRFAVKVASVRTLNNSGKATRTLIKGGRRSLKGHRPAFKKAYVKLAKGESIKIFEESK